MFFRRPRRYDQGTGIALGLRKNVQHGSARRRVGCRPRSAPSGRERPRSLLDVTWRPGRAAVPLISEHATFKLSFFMGVFVPTG